MTTWISTGKAARILGYQRDAFRRKFLEAFERQYGILRQPGGHIRWDETLVESLDKNGDKRDKRDKRDCA